MTFGFAELEGGGTRIRIIPELGGRIVSLEAAGHEWLWRNPVLDPRVPNEGASYAETGDSGGYDECFPTVGACRLSGATTSYSGLDLPDHGELWSQAAGVSVETHQDGQSLTCEWSGKRLPYRFRRKVQVTPQGAVQMRYSVANVGAQPIPFIWSSLPTFPLDGATRLDLPNGARARVAARYGDAVRDLTGEFRWPHARLEKRIVDLSQPDRVARRYACKIFIDVPHGVSHAAVEQGESRLDVIFDERVVTNIAIWINKKEWTPFKGGKPYANVVVAPAIGAPDTLSDALGEWRSASSLMPGETKSWSLTWRARRMTAGL